MYALHFIKKLPRRGISDGGKYTRCTHCVNIL